MKIVPLVVATAVAAVIGSSPLLAQSADAPSANTPQSGSAMNAPTHPGQSQWDRDRDWYRSGRQQGGPGFGWMGPWMMGPRAGWMMGQRPGWMGRHAAWRQRPPRGARFTFTRGDARVDIQCPASQSLKDCIDAASTLIDKVAGMGSPPPAGRTKPPAGSSGPMPGGMMPNMPGNRP